MKGLPCFATVATSAMVVTPSPRTRCAPLPLVGRGWGWGSCDFARGAIVISPRHPLPTLPHKGGGSRPSLPPALIPLQERSGLLLSSRLRQLGVDISAVDDDVFDKDARLDLIALQKRSQHVDAE